MTSNQFGKKLAIQIGALISLTIVSIALWVMYRTLHAIRLEDVIHHLRGLSYASVGVALILTVASYFTVTGYDVVALRHVRKQVSYPRAALSAFLASTFGNNIGFAILTGTSMRYRIYSQVGLSAMEIAGVSSMCALTTTLGMSVIFAIAMLSQSSTATQIGLPISPGFAKLTGGLVLLVLVGYVFYVWLSPRTIRTENWSLRLPSATTALAQISLATLNLSLVSSLIYVLLPKEIETDYITFLGVFAPALIAGSASNVPGGIGVFEAILLVGLKDIPPAALLGSILIFRCVYYLTPMGIAALLLAFHEATRHRERIKHIHNSTLDLLDEIGPQIMSVIILFAGTLLLFSGSISVGFERSESTSYVPLFAIEFSHLLGAGAGVGLLISARGIYRRLASSFSLTAKLLSVGILTSMVKGFGYREAIVLTIVLILLGCTRPEFHRDAKLYDEGFPAEWISLLSVIVAITIWLGLFSFKEFPYAADLWWSFAYDGEYSRFLRSTLVVIAGFGVLLLVNVLRSDSLSGLPEKKILDRVQNILKNERNVRANLVLLGDKRLRFSANENAFLMYQIKGKSWVVLGDPVGPEEQHENLIWNFRALCDRYGAWPVYYLVDEEKLPLYEPLGLSIDKIGDDALVPLEDFDIDNNLDAGLRGKYKQARQQDLKLEMVDKDEVVNLIPDLRLISDNWLENTHDSDMGFARGFFDPYYVIKFPCAIMRHNERIVAFAVVWASPDKREIALDLMRFHAEAPRNIMDFVIVEMMLQAKKLGYRYFNLGLAPLPRMDIHPLAPVWDKLAVLMYRQYKEVDDIKTFRATEAQFRPQWRPKYLVSPGGAKLPRILWDIAKLIAQKKTRIRGDERGLNQ